jgi:hypothetical protein
MPLVPVPPHGIVANETGGWLFGDGMAQYVR